MRKKIMLVAVLLMAALTGACQTDKEVQNKSRVEAAFHQYIEENFGDPGQFKEITAVSLIDTFNLADISNTGREIVKLSYDVDKFEDTIMNWLSKKSAPYMSKLRSKSSELEKPLTTHYESIEKYAYCRRDVEQLLKSVEGSENFYIHHEVKARMEDEFGKWVSVYHVYIDKNDKITVRNRPMIMGSLPDDWFKLSSKVEDLAELIRTKMDSMRELRAIIESVGGRL